MVEIYNTNTKRPETLNIEGGRTIQVGMNQDVILWRIANTLYKHAASGIRELIANALTAIENAIDEGYLDRGDSLVSITFKKDGRLVIEDNGTGISIAVLEQALSVMGNSTNFSNDRPGQMGMGIFAYTCVSSTMFIETRTEDGESFMALCRDAREFQVFDKSSRTSRGTTITMMLYDGETDDDGVKLPLVDRQSLLEMARLIGLASKANINIDVEDDAVPDLPDWISGGHAKFAATGLQKVVDLTQFPVPIIETEDLEIAVDVQSGATVAYLAGMPIALPDIGGGIYVNLKDERKFRPMPDRERLTSNSEKLAVDSIRRALNEKFNSLGITDYDSFKRSEYAAFYASAVSEFSGFDPDIDDDLRSMMNGKYFNARAEAHVSLSHILMLAVNNNIVYSKSPDNKFTRTVRMHDKQVVVVCPANSGPLPRKIASKFRMVDIEEYVKSEGLLVSRQRHGKSDLTVYRNEWSLDVLYETQLEDGADEGSVVMLEKRGHKWLLNLMKKTEGRTSFMAFNRELVGDGRVIPYGRWITSVMERVVDTNKGPMRVSDLAASRFSIIGDYERNIRDQPNLDRGQASLDVYCGSQMRFLDTYDGILVKRGIDMTEAALVKREAGSEEIPESVSVSEIIERMYGVTVDPHCIDQCLDHIDGKDDVQTKMILAASDMGSDRLELASVPISFVAGPGETVDERVEILRHLTGIGMDGASDRIITNLMSMSGTLLQFDSAETVEKILTEIVLPSKDGALSRIDIENSSKSSFYGNFVARFNSENIDLSDVHVSGWVVFFTNIRTVRDADGMVVTGKVFINC